MARGDEPVRAPSVKFSYEDLLNFPDDGRRHEIIDGEHYVTPSPATKHQAVSFNLAGLLWAYLKQHPIGAVFTAPFDVIFSDVDIVEPDLLFVSQERLGIITAKHVRGSPDLVIEILSPASRRVDEITKRKLYERFDVREYWIIDPELDAVKIYRRGDGGLVRVAELSQPEDAVETPLLPGLALRLADIFAVPV